MWDGPLEKIDDYRWRIPKSYKPGMRVDGIIYADEKLLKDIRHDRAAEQVANVAFLPGIVKASLGMPDLHWGYGFPIGGVAATDVEKGGVVSPGGVGFDINCLCATTFIFNELGYKKQIKDFGKSFTEENLRCMDFRESKEDHTRIAAFLKQKPGHTVLSVITETGRQINATEDHPFYTKDGMKPAGKIKIAEEVAIYPFAGVDHEEPSPEIILDEEDIRKALLELGKDSKGSAVEQILMQLKKRGLYPLRYDSWQLPYLLRLMGYCFGDGSIYFEGSRKRGTVCFYGQSEDLRKIKEDVKRIGFEAGIYSRPRQHRIKTSYAVVEFDRVEHWLKAASSSFAVLLVALGVPVGNKCRNPYRVPPWLFKAPLWQKRLFLAGLFGAEMSSPKTMTGLGYNFYCPILSMNKTLAHVENGKKFLRDMWTLLSEFGVIAHTISERKELINKEGMVSYRLRLIISDKPDNLIKLYGTIGFEYNQKRRFLANAAVGYLRLKKRTIDERKQAMVLASTRYEGEGCQPQYIFNVMTSKYVSQRFLERSLHESPDREPRMWGDDPTFEEYVRQATEGLGRSGMVWERVEYITDLEYDDYVFDFTVAHRDHNFIADGFVVSNCGVRLLRTELEVNDVTPRIKELVTALFQTVPAGVGSQGTIRASAKDEREIMLRGAAWAVGQGYGSEADLEATEERGAIAGADPDVVSERAVKRGKPQSGTLGSGNHFLEVQVIDQLFDQELVDAFDLRLGQVTVMIHSGSRGFGYQVCDDSLKSMQRCPEKYQINVPDRQLACAPVTSPEGKNYLGAMRAAANYAWNNRQCLMHLTRTVFERIFGASWQKLGMRLVYDVAHNIAKIEKHVVNGRERTLCVHRKGATRAFGPGHPDLPQAYRATGQPVIIPGDMGRNSYLLVGTQRAMEETFGTTCHGAGRLMSRHDAKRSIHFHDLMKELQAKGIVVMAAGHGTLVEEAPQAYKNVNDVVSVVHNAGFARRVCRMRPLGVLKG